MVSISETVFIDAKIEIGKSEDDWMLMSVLLFFGWETFLKKIVAGFSSGYHARITV